MKRVLFFVLALFLVSNCLAQQIMFQQEKYAPSETIIGQIDGIVSDVGSSDIKIFEGRREVFFEKGVLQQNNITYFYVIPTKEGSFNMKLENVLYNNSGVVSSISLERNFTINKLNNSIGFGVRPGLYEGQNPEVVITNLLSEKLNVSINKTIITLEALESKKITLEISERFSLYPIGNYTLPINKFGLIEKPENVTELNFTEPILENCIVFEIEQPIGVELNKSKNLSLEILNNCSRKIENAKLVSSEEGLFFYKNNITLYNSESTIINFSILLTEIGKVTSNITLLQTNKSLYSTQLKIYSFENSSGLQVLEVQKENPAIRSCTNENGKFCKEGESCSAENFFYDFNAGEICCLADCINPNEKPTNWGNIVIALLGLIVIGMVGYILMKRSKKLKAPQVEDSFKETEKKYERKFTSPNKK